MCRRKLKRLAVLCLLAASLAVIAWGIVTWRQTRTSKEQPTEQSAEELKPILDELRPSGSAEVLQRFENWMAKNVVRGRTTETDIVAHFGKDFNNLDRPKRDRIRTISYHLYGDDYWGGSVVFDFDSRTGLLQDWQTSFWICGFCPHILANDGQWRLEGKMLAGRIGSRREGPDTLLLPRLVPQNQRLRVRLANWAPETEYLDQVQLGVVPCEAGHEVDTDAAGQPYVWKENRTIDFAPIREGVGRDGWMLSVGEPAAGRVIVLEARNTGEFEKVMRKAVFSPGTSWPPAHLVLRFDDGSTQKLQPPGTKFLRRIVVPVPPEARTLQISAPGNLWLVRRAWLGQGHAAQGVTWLSAIDASGLDADALGLLRDRDGQRLVLAPMQEVDLGFMAPRPTAENLPHRFVLRMWGYYDFLPSAREDPRDPRD
jgi:hypothetical protein